MSSPTGALRGPLKRLSPGEGKALTSASRGWRQHDDRRRVLFDRLGQVLRLQAHPNRLRFRFDHVPTGPGHRATDHREHDVHPERQERDGDRLEDAAEIEVELKARRRVAEAVTGSRLHRYGLDLRHGPALLPVAVAHGQADLVYACIRVRVGARILTRAAGPVPEIPVPSRDRDSALAG